MNYPLVNTAKLQAALSQHVTVILQLLQNTPVQRSVNLALVQESLRKAIAPTFDIVFAGAFSAGKSMLINALLERELLYSAEGHATGTECLIAHAEPEQERVVLTFLSEADIQAQVVTLAEKLGIESATLANWRQVRDRCLAIIQAEGGESKSERAKQASGLRYLLEGAEQNGDRIHASEHQTFSMEQFNFNNLQEAAAYARRGANSAVLKRIEYFCHHPLLQDGNVLVDTPGIDAPVKQDAELTYRKVEHPDTSAVVCVLKPASVGDMTMEETQLLELIQGNPGIRDRVFYVFNRVDETWYNTQLRQRLERLLDEQFPDSDRVYKTSALLGFYGSQLRQTTEGDRFGLNTLFADSVKGLGGEEETPQFINEFNRYCASSGKLPAHRFRIDIRSYESPNDNYVRVLSEQGSPLVEQLILDSGIDSFRTAITRYLTEEKRPQLLMNLVDDLTPIYTQLRQHYLEAWHELQRQPQDVDAIKEQELGQLGQELRQVGEAFQRDMEMVVNEAIASATNAGFEKDFQHLQARMVSCLDELLNTFSVGDVHRRAQGSHRRNSVVPLLGILSEAFYYLANGLEDTLVECASQISHEFFHRLKTHVKKQEYHRQLHRLLGHDAQITHTLDAVCTAVTEALTSEARIECDRYVRERPEFFDEETASIWQLRQTLQQACAGYDYHNMVEAEDAIRQVLKIDFEQKVQDTILRTFRQTINQTLNTHLRVAATQQVDLILRQYDDARIHLAKILEKEATEKIRRQQRLQSQFQEQIDVFNGAIAGLNECIEQSKIDRELMGAIAL
ncbi:MAG: dynamin-like GTPase family protein [Leptolyngbyaceae bacterium]|nr:dynamin-like GTPase family protein [Leptolyngbyaceae bacterium]